MTVVDWPGGVDSDSWEVDRSHNEKVVTWPIITWLTTDEGLSLGEWNGEDELHYGEEKHKKTLVGIVHMLDTPVTTRIAYFLHIFGNIL